MLLCALAGPARAAGPAQAPYAAGRFEAQLLDEDDGLGNLVITAFAQQTDGRLWVATQNGVFRYDGSVFESFGPSSGLEDPQVYSLLIDHAGTLWAGSHGGLFWFDGSRFHKVLYASGGLRIGINSMLAATNTGELIAETSHGLVSVRVGGQPFAWHAQPFFQAHPGFPKSEDTDGIVLDQAGRLWFGCAGKLCEYDLPGPGGLRTLGPGQGVPDDFYVSMFAARDGRLWARGRKHIVSWRPDDRAVEDRTASFPPDGLRPIYRRFTEDRWGNILTPAAKGFALWDGQHWSATERTGRGELGVLSDVFSDREGVLWLGSDGLGLLRSRGYHLWQNYGSEEGLENAGVLALAASTAGQVWIGHNLGADILAPGAAALSASALQRDRDVSSIVGLAPSPDGGMWAATLQGRLFHVRADGRIDVRAALDRYIERICLDGHGTVWIATSAGLYQLAAGAEHAPVPVSLPGLNTLEISDLALDPDGALWLASVHGLDHLRDGRLTHFSLPGQPESLTIVTRSRDGSLWIAGWASGVSHFAFEAGHLRLLERLAKPILASDLIEFIGEDKAGRTWIGTDHGMNVVQGGKLYRLDREDGLIWSNCSAGAFWPADDGSVWVGTSAGLSHLIDPEAVLERPPFQIQVGAVRYGGRTLLPGARVLWTGGPTAIHFSALTFRGNASMLYHTRLIGFDAEPTTSASASLLFQKLPPGKYVLQVVAEDAGHQVRSAPASFAFTLTPPWWRSRAWYALIMLLCLGLIMLLWWWRHLALLANQRKLEKLVETRTHELEQMALLDGLTGLPNRRAVFLALEAELERVSGQHSTVCVALVDLDYFKAINDTYGHLAGDDVLRTAAARLLASVRSTDIVGRYGGEEFLVVFRDAKRELGLERCELLRTALSATPIAHGGRALPVTCSIGLAWSDTQTKSMTELLAAADRALYAAKARGRDRVVASEDTA